jgi:DNA-binding NarL/FixJ family response regulator
MAKNGKPRVMRPGEKNFMEGLLTKRDDAPSARRRAGVGIVVSSLGAPITNHKSILDSDTSKEEPQQTPYSSAFASSRPLGIALVDKDEDTQRVFRQIVQSHAPTWTLQVFPDALSMPIEAWMKAAKTRSGRSKSGILSTHPLPHVIIIDIGSEGDGRIQFIRKLKWLLPACRVLVLTHKTGAGGILAALKAGAAGYLTKPQDSDFLAKALQEIAVGGLVLCREAQTVLLSCLHRGVAGHPAEGLTRREWDVVQGLASGLTDKSIASDLGIAPGTVHALARRIFRKLNAHSRREAVQRALGGFRDPKVGNYHICTLFSISLMFCSCLL